MMMDSLTPWSTLSSWAARNTPTRHDSLSALQLAHRSSSPSLSLSHCTTQGVLDQVANRCLAQGTNAWTDVDHTCYTVTTAGSEGFLNLLPIYLDHILYPTLTVTLHLYTPYQFVHDFKHPHNILWKVPLDFMPLSNFREKTLGWNCVGENERGLCCNSAHPTTQDAAYLTEVHHVNGEGEDAGVVYCEMQGRENTAEELSSFLLSHHMYPGHCGYKSNTGGKMSNLRETCSNDKVRTATFIAEQWRRMIYLSKSYDNLYADGTGTVHIMFMCVCQNSALAFLTTIVLHSL